MDLHDRRITQALRGYRTKGWFVIEPEGVLFNTDTVANEIVFNSHRNGFSRHRPPADLLAGRVHPSSAVLYQES